MSEALTPLESRVYYYLLDFLAENTYQPSIREIARKFRIKSTKTVSDLLQRLEHKGYIERDESRSRGVRLLGFAAARGTQPIPYYANADVANAKPPKAARAGFITLDRRFLPSGDAFFLKMQGHGMTQRGILDGDYVMIDPSAQAKDGDVVAVRRGGETMVRILAHRGATVVLEPANESERPLEIGAKEDFAVLGVLAGVFRPFWEREPTPTLPLEEDLPVS